MTKVSCIVPVLNEEPGLESTLEPIAALRDRIDLEILLIVDIPDPRREQTSRDANDLVAKSVDARVVYRVGERGFGSALRRGFSEAEGEIMIPIMGDASEEPEDIVRLAQESERGSWDIVAGSRYMRGGRTIGNTPKQRLSRFYSMLVRLAGGIPVHDVSNAFKAYRRNVVDGVQTESQSFDLSVEITVKAAAAGYSITELPTVWKNRRAGSSSFSIPAELRNYGRWLVFAAMHPAAGSRTSSGRRRS